MAVSNSRLSLVIILITARLLVLGYVPMAPVVHNTFHSKNLDGYWSKVCSVQTAMPTDPYVINTCAYIFHYKD